MRPRSMIDLSHTQTYVLVSARAFTALSALMFARAGITQEASLNAPATQASQTHKFQGVDGCRDCHRKASDERKKAGVTDFVSLNESVVWVSDVHSKAFESIDPTKSDLGKQICEKLGITNIHNSRECLSCHSDWRPGLEKPSTYERGVACESCHGPSFDWDREHRNDSWRAKPVADKEALGMIDVRNPIKRAEQCFGCHIGNVAEGKIITHAMYAAGHPPLPGIEIESFAQQMPRHWRYLEEKIAAAKLKAAGNDPAAASFAHFEEFVHENHKYFNPTNGSIPEQVAGHKHRPAAVILGGAIALREYLELIRDLASTEESDARTWPELATYDCRACHHELEAPGWRQERRVGSIPGRPMLPQWPATLVPLAIRHAAADDDAYAMKLAEFREMLSSLQAELERTPFGSPVTMEKRCSDLLKWLETEVIAPALAKPFDSRAIGPSFKLLVEIGSTGTHDYESARQIAWATRILSCGISKKEIRDAINATLEPLTPELRLDLLNSSGELCAPVSELDEARELGSLASGLSDALSAAYQYEPDQFRENMQKLGESLR